MTKETTTTIAKTTTTFAIVGFVVGLVIREFWKTFELSARVIAWTSTEVEYSEDTIKGAYDLAYTFGQLTDAAFIFAGLCTVIAVGAWFGTASRNK